MLRRQTPRDAAENSTGVEPKWESTHFLHFPEPPVPPHTYSKMQNKQNSKIKLVHEHTLCLSLALSHKHTHVYKHTHPKNSCICKLQHHFSFFITTSWSLLHPANTKSFSHAFQTHHTAAFARAHLVTIKLDSSTDKIGCKRCTFFFFKTITVT